MPTDDVAGPNTFSTHHRWILPESVRDVVLKHCLHDYGTKLWIHGLVVMPDHKAFHVSDDTDQENRDQNDGWAHYGELKERIRQQWESLIWG